MSLTSQLIFVTGGARSGKSSFAEQLAKNQNSEVTYLATAQAFDEEMTDRIIRHQNDRPAKWKTIEEPLNIPQIVKQIQTPIILLDCLSLWVSNMILADLEDKQILAMTDELLDTLQHKQAILVTNEVGLSIVPENALARRYRDILGWVNQKCAASSHEAWMLVSGLPIQLKGK